MSQSQIPIQVHYCRWDWCNETFTSAQQHREHIEEHVKRVVPIRRSDVKLVQRAEGNYIQNAITHAEDSSAKPSGAAAAVVTESFSFQQPPLPPPAVSPSQIVPPVPSLSSDWFTLSSMVPLATSTQLQSDPAVQPWEPQSQLPFNLDHSITSNDSNH